MAWANNNVSHLVSNEEVNAMGVIYPKEAEAIFNKFITDKFDPNRINAHNKLTKDWLRNVLSHGTHRDKIAAYSYLIVTEPLKTISYIDKLIDQVSPKNHNVCIESIVSLKTLFINVLLPDRPLYKLEVRSKNLIEKYQKYQNPDKSCLPPKDSYEYAIIMWKYEDILKEKFTNFINKLEQVVIADCVEAVKNAALTAMHDLVFKKSENVERILSIMINKLGDRSKKFSSTVIHKIRNLIMKKVEVLPLIIEEINRIIVRPGSLSRCVYYAVSVLSCIQYPKRGSIREKKIALTGAGLQNSEAIAGQVVRLYTGFFKMLIQQNDNEKLMNCVLTGLRRAAPYCKSIELGECIKDLFLLVHTAKSLKLSVQSLSVIHTLIKIHKGLADESEQTFKLETRFFNCLWVKLLDPSFRWFSGKKVLLSLVHDSLLMDEDNKRIIAFITRLLELAVNSPDFATAIAILIIIDKVRCLEKHAEYDLLSFDKILENTTLPEQSEQLKKFESDDEEFFEDAQSSDEDERKKARKSKKDKKKILSTWCHREKPEESEIIDTTKGYDLFCRDPRSANIPKYAVLFLLKNLSMSTHPTISLYANSILNGNHKTPSLKFDGDPLTDFSMCKFLEKFSMKKPKEDPKSETKEHDPFSSQKSKSSHIGLFNYDSCDLDKIPSDEQFIHKYLKLADDLGLDLKRERKRFQEVEDDDFDSYLEKHERGLAGIMMDADADYEESDQSDGQNDDEFDYSDDEEESLGDSNASGSLNEEEFGSDFEDMDFDNADQDEGFDDSDDDEMRTTSQKDKLSSLFASADEVAHLFEDQADKTLPKGKRNKKFNNGNKRNKKRQRN